jgi:hypothetical protein
MLGFLSKNIERGYNMVVLENKVLGVGSCSVATIKVLRP